MPSLHVSYLCLKGVFWGGIIQTDPGSDAIPGAKGGGSTRNGAQTVRRSSVLNFRARCAYNGWSPSAWLTVWIAPRQPLALPKAIKRRWQSRNSSCHG